MGEGPLGWDLFRALVAQREGRCDDLRNICSRPHPRAPLIAPSILSADFGILADETRHSLAEAGGDLVHVDIMDGHFVPNVTMGPALLASLRKHLPSAFFDVHLMVTDPIQYVGPFADAGANHITFHIEPALDVRAGTGMSPLSAGYDAARRSRRPSVPGA